MLEGLYHPCTGILEERGKQCYLFVVRVVSLLLMLPFVLFTIYVLHQGFLVEQFFGLPTSSSFYFTFLDILVVAVVIAKVFNYSVLTILINGCDSVTLASFSLVTFQYTLNDERKQIKDQKHEMTLVLYLLSFIF